MMAKNAAELQVVEGNNQFTSNMYQILAKKTGNVIFSPISIHAVLSMTYQGAQGSTVEKLASALHISDAKSAAGGYKSIMNNLNSVKNVTLLMANKIFLKEGAKLLSDFSISVTDSFLSEVQLIDFVKNEHAAATINRWVEKKTNSKIQNLIDKSALGKKTRLVLVNAIYFKGNWKHKFNKTLTKVEPFFLNHVDKVDVKMMHIKESFRYKFDKALDAQILELPYTSEDLSMFIILPKEKNGISELEKKLAEVNLAQTIQNLWRTQVVVALPKFKIEQTIDLQNSLTQLGLGEIFDEDKANFRGMIQLEPDENIYVSNVVQKAFIEVNEEGAEAAAATATRMTITTRCYRRPEQPITFIADHPFIYVLGTRSGNHLFMGRISKLVSSNYFL